MNYKNFILILLISIFCTFSLSFAADNSSQDAFQVILNELGIDENDLGWEPKGYWTRFPDPQDIPYKPLAFDDLCADPQYLYDFTRIMALAVEDYLHPDYLAGNAHDGLLRVAYYTGVRNATSQFRDYSASLWSELDDKEPLLNAVKAIYQQTGRVFNYNRMGEPPDFPFREEDLRKAISPIHMEIRKAVASTLYNMLDAWRFQQIAVRNIDFKDAAKVWRIRQLGETQYDAMEYFPELDDCAQNLDLNSIYYAGYKLLDASQVLADTLTKLKDKLKVDGKTQNLNIMTPLGRIVIAGSGKNEHKYSDAFLVVDLGGNDTYIGSAGSTPSLSIPISLFIDLEGDDKYLNDDEYLPSQGSAILGAAMLLDMKGDDYYESKRLSQGAAMLGIGILADMEGDDVYRMWTSGQGGAYFGVGLAIDNRGNDEYYIWGDGQGYGGVGGVGSLVNRSGNDKYWAEPLSANVFRPDPSHSKGGKINYSYVQGCGVGRRGDITDGHSWAGGMGTIIDLEGKDTYESGNWSLGCGYWYGIGLAYDGSGDDTYKSASWTQGAGAHFCIGAFFDEGGDDIHECWEEPSVGMGFGHDYTLAMFYDRSGNDVYKLRDDGLGYAINMSQVYFIDTEGDDEYITGGKRYNYGWNNFQQYNPPIIGAFQILFSNQICIFTDISGKDVYKNLDPETGIEKTDERLSDGAELFTPTDVERDSLSNKRYYGLGKDFKDWNGPEIEYFRDKMKKRFEEFKK